MGAFFIAGPFAPLITKGYDFASLFRGSDGIGSAGPFPEIGRTGAHVAAFRDGAIEPRTTYSYRVLAWNSSGASSPSNVVVTPPPAGTEPPAD